MSRDGSSHQVGMDNEVRKLRSWEEECIQLRGDRGVWSSLCQTVSCSFVPRPKCT